MANAGFSSIFHVSVLRPRPIRMTSGTAMNARKNVLCLDDEMERARRVAMGTARTVYELILIYVFLVLFNMWDLVLDNIVYAYKNVCSNTNGWDGWDEGRGYK